MKNGRNFATSTCLAGVLVIMLSAGFSSPVAVLPGHPYRIDDVVAFVIFMAGLSMTIWSIVFLFKR